MRFALVWVYYVWLWQPGERAAARGRAAVARQGALVRPRGRLSVLCAASRESIERGKKLYFEQLGESLDIERGESLDIERGDRLETERGQILNVEYGESLDLHQRLRKVGS